MANLGLRPASRALGVSHVTLLNHWKDGRVPRNADGSFDIEAVKVAFAAGRDPSQVSKIPEPSATPEPAPAPAPVTAPVAAPQPRPSPPPPVNPGLGLPSVDQGFNRIRTALHAVKLKDATLSLAVREGEMVRAEDVLQEWNRHIETAKNRLLLLPAKIAPRVAGIRNIAECHQIIEREVNMALIELGGYAPE